MNIKPSRLALAPVFFWLLTSSSHAQETTLLDQREAATPTITITAGLSPSGAGTIVGAGAKAAGKSFTLAATPSASLKAVFLNWTINGVVVSTKSPYIFTPTISETVVANFGYAITTSSSSAAGGKTSGAGTYPSGQNVTVIATPND